MKMKYIFFGTILLLAAVFHSCQDEDIVRGGNNKMLRFVITTQDEQVVNTRADNDKTLSDVYVLLFHTNNASNPTDAEYTFVAAASATTTDTEANQYRLYFADVSEEISGNSNGFCIVANTGNTVNANLEKWKNTNSTLEDIKKDMKIALQMQGGNIIEDPRTAPMCSSLKTYNGMEEEYQVDLERATAKFTVTVSETDKGTPVNVRYQLLGTSLGNMSTAGYVFGMPTATIENIAKANYAGKSGSSYSPEYMMHGAQTGVKQSEPVYAFPTTADKEPFVIIKGEYNGIAGYHRINLYDRNTKAFYEVKRNYHYKVNIGKITTVGYATAQEAIDDTDGSNDDLTVDITVDDGTSRDIVTNGTYYLGLSNSELVVYSSEDLVDIHVATIKYDKTLAAGANASITYETTDGVGDITYNTDVLTNSATDGRLIASIPKRVIKGEFTVRIGELAKKIKIERRLDGLSLGGAFMLHSENLVYGKVLTATNNNTPWISISTSNSTDVSSGTDEYFNAGTKREKVSLIVANNLDLGVTNPQPQERVAELTVTKADDQGHSKILIYQPVFNIFDKDESNIATINNPYVGAFWRSNQKGERVIKMEITNVSVADKLTWDATVVVGSDWAGLQLGGSNDPAIYTGIPGDAESFPIPEKDMEMFIQGTSMTPTFRIGLTGTIGKDEHRYGLVLVNTYFDGAIQNTYKIFLRQGDSPDYLFRSGDGGYQGWAGSRDKAVKLSAYNLTDPKLGKGKDGDLLSHNLMPLDYYSGNTTFNRNEFTEYPSQSGYFYIWNVTPGSDIKNPDLKAMLPSITKAEGYARAYHPLFAMNIIPLYYIDMADANLSRPPTSERFYRDVVPTFYDTKGDPCPYGYRYPKVGKLTENGTSGGHPKYYTDISTNESEAKQSLAFNTEISSPAGMSSYTLWGYYADGFFDRLEVNDKDYRAGSRTISSFTTVVKGTSTDFVTRLNNASGNDVGYNGMLIFNPYNLSSLFFPATGRSLISMILELGTAFYVWAGDKDEYIFDVAACYPMDWSGTRTQFTIFGDQGAPYQLRAVRCVRDENIADDAKVVWDPDPKYNP